MAGSLNFHTWHYIYFFVLYLPSSLALWASVSRGATLGYLDSLFLCISAGTGAGLSTVDLSSLNTFQQTILYLSIVLGSPTLVFSIFVNVLRVRYKLATKREREIIARYQELQKTLSEREVNARCGVFALPEITPVVERKTEPQIWDKQKLNECVECAEMFGEKYQAFALLSWLVPLYLVTFQLAGSLAIGAYVMTRYPEIPAQNSLNPWWFASFNAISAFNNSGMSLLDANMSPFQEKYFILAVMSVLILVGNTCFPIVLRVLIWCLSKGLPAGDSWKGTRGGVKLLLQEGSRKFCPYMFTRSELSWLATTVFVLNGVDWAAFGISSAINPNTQDMPVLARVFDGLFQAFAVRSGGFAIVNISSLSIGVQALYVAMMYISSFPISPNILYDPSKPDAAEEAQQQHLTEFLRRQVNRTFTLDDFGLLAMAVWIIAMLETPHSFADPVGYGVFNILFETVSAYGCVGVSTGHPSVSTSFVGVWRGESKLLLCGVMLWGRTREVKKGVLVGRWGIGEEIDREGARDISAVAV